MTEPRKPIVVVGSATMDLVTRTPRIPATGQTSIGTAFETTPGGKGANQAVAAARFANTAAALCVTRKGAQASMPSRDEVEAFLAGSHL